MGNDSAYRSVFRLHCTVAQNGQCMTSKYRESDKRADGSYAFEWYFDVIH